MNFLAILLLTIQTGQYRFDPPPDLREPQRSMFLHRMREDRYEQSFQAWKDNCNPERLVSEKVVELTEKLNCAIQVRPRSAPLSIRKTEDLKITPRSQVAIDDPIGDVGLSVEQSVYEPNKKAWNQLARGISQRFKSKKFADSVDEIPNFLEDFRRQFFRDASSLTILVTFQRVDFKVENESASKSECWMLVDIFPSAKDHPIFPRIVVHDLLLQSGGRAMVLVEPHPQTKLDERMSSQFLKKPLTGNRKSPFQDHEVPIAAIEDDGLTMDEREELLNFSLLDDTKRKTKDAKQQQYQIEGIIYPEQSSAFIERDSKLMDTLTRRLPPGKLVTFDELHRICAEFTRLERNLGHKPVEFSFSIIPHQHGKYTYEALYIRAITD